MARTTTPAIVPLAQAGIDHPFLFRGKAYKRVEDTWADGARKPEPMSAEALAASHAAQDAAHARLRAQAEARAAAALAAKAERVEQARGVADPEAKARHDEAVAYVKGYTGTWGLPLDIRADRKWGTKYLKLTDAQVAALLAGKARDAERAAAAVATRHPRYDEAVALASTWASSRNDFQVAMHGKAVTGQPLSDRMVEAILRNAPVARPEAPAAPAGPAITEGLWVLNGTPVKVQRAVNGSGNLYAKRWVDGEFVYEAGLIRAMANATPMSEAEAMAFGKLYGVCMVCGRPLTDETSIELGIGPVCRGKAVWA